MGRGDPKHSMKMKRRTRQRKKLARLRRRIEAATGSAKKRKTTKK
jgi:hypothetical protein